MISWLIFISSASSNIWKSGHNSEPGHKKVVLHLVVRSYEDIVASKKMKDYRKCGKIVASKKMKD